MISDILLNKFVKSELNGDQWFILLLKTEKKLKQLSLLMNRIKNLEETLYSLESLDYIRITDDIYNDDLTANIDCFFVKEKGISLFLSDSINFKDLAEKIRNLFPAGIKTGGYYVRGSVSSIEAKLKKFNKKFPQYSEEDIINATKNYIDRKRKENWNMIKTAENFIFKDEVSILAAECENLRDEMFGEMDDEWTRNIM